MSTIANTKISLDQMVVKDLYYKYRAFVTPLSVIGICVLLFYFVIIPQIQGWLSIRDALATDTQNVSVLHANLATVTQLDDASLNTYLTTATSALPADKDFAGIITSLQNAAALSGAGLGDYSFQLGDLSGLDQNGKASQLPVQLNVVLKADVPTAERFVTQLKKQLPLSDTIAVAANANASTTVTVIFYYATLPKIVFHDTTPLPIVSTADKNLLESLAANNNVGTTTLETPQASISATPSPLVTATPTTSPTVTPTSSPTPVATGSAK